MTSVYKVIWGKKWRFANNITFKHYFGESPLLPPRYHKSSVIPSVSEGSPEANDVIILLYIPDSHLKKNWKRRRHFATGKLPPPFPVNIQVAVIPSTASAVRGIFWLIPIFILKNVIAILIQSDLWFST